MLNSFPLIFLRLYTDNYPPKIKFSLVIGGLRCQTSSKVEQHSTLLLNHILQVPSTSAFTCINRFSRKIRVDIVTATY